MITKKQIVSILLWSLLGCFLIFLGHSFSNRGFLTTIPPYAFVMIVSIIFYKPKTNNFKLFFVYGLSVFMVISIFSVIYILTFENPAARAAPFSHYMKVLGFMLSIGIPCAAILAGFTYLIKKNISGTNPPIK